MAKIYLTYHKGLFSGSPEVSGAYTDRMAAICEQARIMAAEAEHNGDFKYARSREIMADASYRIREIELTS